MARGGGREHGTNHGAGAGWSSDELRVALAFAHGADPGRGLRPGLASLERLGFRVSALGARSASLRAPRALFERVFGTRLKRIGVNPGPAGRGAATTVYYPPHGAPWAPGSEIAESIQRAYIQWPHIYMDGPVFPPRVAHHHLRLPGDLAIGLNAARVHRRGVTGQGVRVAVVDSGFALAHPYFRGVGLHARVVLGPGATRPRSDRLGHGTGVLANLLAIAPEAEVVGVKLDDDRGGHGASLLEGFQTALGLRPHLISLSVGYDLVEPGSRTPLPRLPNGLAALRAEIEAAVRGGIVVVAAAGNGHVAFPAMLPGVLSAGGVFMDEHGSMSASDYASVFTSRPFPGRRSPDVCGLVGMARNRADYLMLPVPPGSRIDRENAAHDGTGPRDGWAVFSGTSSAAPQVAGVCALLLQRDPSLTPLQVRNVLCRTARRVRGGRGNPASASGRGERPRHGLVDAHAALGAL